MIAAELYRHIPTRAHKKTRIDLNNQTFQTSTAKGDTKPCTAPCILRQAKNSVKRTRECQVKQSDFSSIINRENVLIILEGVRRMSLHTH